MALETLQGSGGSWGGAVSRGSEVILGLFGGGGGGALGRAVGSLLVPGGSGAFLEPPGGEEGLAAPGLLKGP